MTTRASAKPSAQAEFIELIKTVVYALALAMLIRFAFVQPFRIPSGSMQPSLMVGDYIVVSKWSYGYSRFSIAPLWGFAPGGRLFANTPERGDVAVFRPATQPKTDFVKRIIGLPGDRIQMRGGVLYLNGEPVRRELVGEQEFRDGVDRVAVVRVYQETLPDGRSYRVFERGSQAQADCFDQYGVPRCEYDDTPEYVVPENHYFMMGDDRDNSEDSRSGQVGYVPFDNLVGRAEFVFVSFDYETSLFRPWTLLTELRGERFFKGLE